MVMLWEAVTAEEMEMMVVVERRRWRIEPWCTLA